MKNDKYLLVSMSMSIVLMIFLMLILMSPVTTVVFSSQNDTFEANVTVANAIPVVSNVALNDENTEVNITLTAGSDTNWVVCNATITDNNGWQDLAGANGTIWHESLNTSGGAYCTADKNNCYHNDSCIFTGGSGTTIIAECKFPVEHEALNGTWVCNLTVWDNYTADGYSDAYPNGSATAEIDQLVALTINETNISFGTMNVGDSSSTANWTNITNQGNVKIDVQVKGLAADMDCDVLGKIGIQNISYNVTDGPYDSMYPVLNLTTNFDEGNLSSFNLGVEGMTTTYGFAEDEPATNNTYWTIHIPNGVRGTCNVSIMIGAIISDEGT